MEATINIDDRKTFNTLIEFLKSLNIDVDTKGKKRIHSANKKINSTNNKWDELLMFVSKRRKKLPDGFKFNS